jgi:virginiamycin B lyase
VWFVEIGGGRIGCCPATGEVAEYPLWDAGAKPHAITADPAGGCWFTAWAANRVGYISGTGEVVSFPIPTPDAEPHGIAIAPDGSVWGALEVGKLLRLSR